MKRDYETIELIKKFALLHRQTLSGRGPYRVASELLLSLGVERPEHMHYKTFAEAHLKFMRDAVKKAQHKRKAPAMHVQMDRAAAAHLKSI